MGGTARWIWKPSCPTLFSAFVDIAGDFYERWQQDANHRQVVRRQRRRAWSAFDPTTVITRHGSYTRRSGWFALITGPPSPDNACRRPPPVRLAGVNPGNQAAANALCALGPPARIYCAVVLTGQARRPFADRVFFARHCHVAGRQLASGEYLVTTQLSRRYRQIGCQACPTDQHHRKPRRRIRSIAVRQAGYRPSNPSREEDRDPVRVASGQPNSTPSPQAAGSKINARSGWRAAAGLASSDP